MRKQLIKNAMIFALVAICGYAYSQETVLQYKFVKGQTYTQEMVLTNNMIQSFGGQEMKMIMDMSSLGEMFIEDINENGDITAIELLKDISIHSVMMGKDTTMTYTDINEKCRIVYSKEGNLISREIIDTASIASLTGATNQTARLIYLPGKSIKSGDKWQNTKTDKNEISEKNPIETVIVSNEDYTYLGKEALEGKEFEKISMESTSVIEGQGSQMGMELYMDGNGKSQGFAYFDTVNSMIVYSEIDTEMNMTIAFAGQENMTIPMIQSMKVVSKFRIKK